MREFVKNPVSLLWTTRSQAGDNSVFLGYIVPQNNARLLRGVQNYLVFSQKLNSFYAAFTQAFNRQISLLLNNLSPLCTLPITKTTIYIKELYC